MLIKPPAGFIVAVAAMLAFTAGWTVNGWRYKGREAKALEQAYAERDAANAKANGLAADYERLEFLRILRDYGVPQVDGTGTLIAPSQPPLPNQDALDE